MFLGQPQLLAAVKFIAHLVNQQVAHEIVALNCLLCCWRTLPMTVLKLLWALWLNADLYCRTFHLTDCMVWFLWNSNYMCYAVWFYLFIILRVYASSYKCIPEAHLSFPTPSSLFLLLLCRKGYNRMIVSRKEAAIEILSTTWNNVFDWWIWSCHWYCNLTCRSLHSPRKMESVDPIVYEIAYLSYIFVVCFIAHFDIGINSEQRCSQRESHPLGKQYDICCKIWLVPILVVIRR